MLKSESLPSAFVYVEKGSSTFYHYIKSSNQPLDSPKLLGTLLLPTSLKCKCLFLLLYYQDLLTILNCIQPAL